MLWHLPGNAGDGNSSSEHDNHCNNCLPLMRTLLPLCQSTGMSPSWMSAFEISWPALIAPYSAAEVLKPRKLFPGILNMGSFDEWTLFKGVLVGECKDVSGVSVPTVSVKNGNMIYNPIHTLDSSSVNKPTDSIWN